jgi:hypothetical protein
MTSRNNHFASALPADSSDCEVAVPASAPVALTPTVNWEAAIAAAEGQQRAPTASMTSRNNHSASVLPPDDSVCAVAVPASAPVALTATVYWEAAIAGQELAPTAAMAAINNSSASAGSDISSGPEKHTKRDYNALVVIKTYRGIT